MTNRNVLSFLLAFVAWTAPVVAMEGVAGDVEVMEIIELSWKNRELNNKSVECVFNENSRPVRFESGSDVKS